MKILVEQGKEAISGTGGLLIVGGILKTHKIGIRADSVVFGGEDPKIKNSDVLLAYIGLLCMGRTAYTDIELYRKDSVFKATLGIKTVPSEGTMRQRLDAGHAVFTPLVNEVNEVLLSAVKPTPVKIGAVEYFTLDVDVSTMDNSKSRKEGVGRTYMKIDGFSPIFAYLGIEGFMLACELRPGKQHCQKGTPDFLKTLLTTADKVLPKDSRKLFRLDSGNDASENIGVFKKAEVDFVVKRNLRKERLQFWAKIAKEKGVELSPREGKKLWRGETTLHVKGVGQTRVVFEVVERKTRFNKKLEIYEPLVIPDIEVSTFWTSLAESPDQIIELYHQHGTSEQFHSELKSDMGVERLPSGKFKTNSLILTLSMLSFNVLRTIGMELLADLTDLPVKLDVARRRIKSIIMDLVLSGCKLVKGGNYLRLKFGPGYAWFAPFRRLYLKFC